jgi:hypothetical protein
MKKYLSIADKVTLDEVILQSLTNFQNFYNFMAKKFSSSE